MGILDNILSSLRVRPWWSETKSVEQDPGLSLEDVVALLISAQGESSALTHARDLMARIGALDEDALKSFFDHLLSLDIDVNALIRAAEAYRDEPSAAHFKNIKTTSEPKLQRVFERINACQEGTVFLVRLRAKLLKLIRQYPELARIDVTLNSLMMRWFNRGFLVLEPINWST